MIKEGFNSERILRYFHQKHSEKDASYIDELFSNSENDEELRRFLLKQFYEFPKEDIEQKDLSHILYSHRIHYEINIDKLKQKWSRS